MSDNIKILKNYLLYFATLIIICIIGASGVFALEYTDIGYVHTLSGVNGQVIIDVTYETESGAPLTINRNQVVYTQLKVMNVFVSNYSFEANRQYQIEMEFPYQQLQYANTYQVFGANNELCSINYSNSIFNSQWPRWNWSCPHSTNEIYLKVYNSNNTAITSYGDWSWNYMFMRYTNTSIDSDITDTDSITNNANQNADRIINNNNENTQKIIDENKKNFNTCRNSVNLFNKNNVIYVNKKILNNNGVEVSDSTGGYTKMYIPVKSNTEYTISGLPSLGSKDIYYFDNNKTYIGHEGYFGSTYHTFTTPSNCKYIDIMYYISGNDFNTYQLQLGSTSTDYEPYGEEICVNKLDNQTNAINGLNDNINDDNTDGATSEASDFFSDFNTNTFGLTSIITAPLNLIQSLTSKTCTPLHLPLPYLDNKYLDLPCMTTIYSEHFGTFFTLYQTITYGIIAYWVCVRIFNHVKDFKNPEHDEIEVVDL